MTHVNFRSAGVNGHEIPLGLSRSFSESEPFPLQFMPTPPPPPPHLRISPSPPTSSSLSAWRRAGAAETAHNLPYTRGGGGGGQRSAKSGQVLKVDCVWCRRRAVGLRASPAFEASFLRENPRLAVGKCA